MKPSPPGIVGGTWAWKEFQGKDGKSIVVA
jgi:hypothetical protein